MAKVFKWIMNLILVIIIVLLATYLFFRLTNRVEIYKVKTGSMEAKIHVGDYILIYRKTTYDIGDVVTYTSNNGFITHRIIKKEGNKVVTKGDANNTPDETINESIIVGKVIISGGILNFVIDYKFAIAGVVLSLYLFSCYFASSKDEKDIDNIFLENDSIKTEEVNEEKEEVTKTEKEEIKEIKEETNIKDKEIGKKDETKEEKTLGEEVLEKSEIKKEDKIEEKKEVVEINVNEIAKEEVKKDEPLVKKKNVKKTEKKKM